MDIALEKKLYLDGIQLFNEGEFFDAHEVWEDCWHEAYGVKYEFYQGMIQCAVALEHYRRSNPRGVVSLYDSYRKHMRDVPDVFMGLDVKSFLINMRDALRPVIEADPLPAKGTIELDLARTPKIALQYDPFENGEAQRFASPQK
jgi:predicted metal-dependent hydrolase